MIRDDMRLAIAAIVKNEAPYLLEWVAYHRVVGVDRFFIADNGSDDGTTEILANLHRAGIIEHIAFPGDGGKAPQLPAYAEIMRRHGKDADLIAFIDADEFLFPTDGETSIRPALADLAQIPDLGAIAVNWACFGSSGQAMQGDDFVIERFSARAEQNLGQNHHYKSIVRSTAWFSNHGTPHSFVLNPGFRTFHTDRQPVEDHVPLGPGLSQQVCWERLRLNHYVVKSRQEFFERKGPKGRASVVGEPKGEVYFVVHDRNEIFEPMPWRFLERTKMEIAAVLKLVSIKTKTVSKKKIRGTIDKISIEGSDARIVGWCMLDNGDRVPFVSVIFDGKNISIYSFNRINRPDVKRVHNCSIDVGFQISLNIENIPNATSYINFIEISAGITRDNLIFSIDTRNIIWPHVQNNSESDVSIPNA